MVIAPNNIYLTGKGGKPLWRKMWYRTSTILSHRIACYKIKYYENIRTLEKMQENVINIQEEKKTTDADS